MFRYIIGVTLIASAIMLIRRLANGRMLRRHQYAIWLLIPIYMIAAPFLKIKVPVADELSSIIPVTVEKAVYENAYINDVLDLENSDAEEIFFEQDNGQDQTVQNQVLSNTEASQKTVRKPVNTSAVLNGIYISVTGAALLVLTAYNAGFVIFCRRIRKSFLYRAR